jgi:OOP family OmpA-OmpF porin
MRLRAILFAAVVLVGAGFAAVHLARMATAWLEATTAERLAAGLDAAGQDWASVTVDGLGVTLAGAAPDETSRFRALEAARGVVDEGRITDATTLDAAALAAPPAFALELLRNGAEVSLIGLVPEEGGRDVIRAALRAGGLSEQVADMLESASDPAPEGWREALGYGLSVLAELPRAKISVAPGRVSVVSVSDSEADQAALKARLRGAAPEGVELALDISAPRPVIAPFAFDFRLADGAGALAACTADSEEAAAAILAAARAAGLAREGTCAVGLGAPSPDWTAAVEAGLDAVAKLGGGRFAMRDLAAELGAPDGTPPERLAEAAAALEAALPESFRLATSAPPPTAAPGEAPAPEARFEAVLLLDGNVRLAGPVQDQTSRAAIASVAAAFFGHDRVLDGTVLDPALPEGWPVRVLAGIEALAALEEGRLEVTADAVSVEGWGLDRQVDERVKALLAAKVGEGAEVDVTFNAEAAAAAALAARPRPEICADQIDAILDAEQIRFAAGSAEIVPESAGMIAAIADVLRGCPGAEFEIAGHTDAQGPETANRQLSEQRAEAVVAALQAQDLPLVVLGARGYGATRPIADNATPAGRARNRRIEFNLGPVPDPEPAPEAAAAPVEASADAAGCVAAVAAILAERTLEFEAGSAELSEPSAPVVSAIGEALAACPGATVEIGGHTDAQGSEPGNLRLSEQRAEAVLAALQAEAAPDALPELVARGYGETEPVADNDSDEGRARNRRIVFQALPAAEAAAPAEAATAADGAVADCVARVGVILAESSIEFAPGSATIADESAPVIEAVREVLRACPDAALEVGGYTDSEGSDSGNLRLSQQRAEAVLAALRTGDLPLAAMAARGYGEADPIADNGTAEGRARNRRIALAPAGPEEIGSDDGSQ